MTAPPRVTVDDFNEVARPAPSVESDGLFVDAWDFIHTEHDPPAPLWGSADVAVIPAGGLAILAGRPGAGKTTFVLDLACHLAAGQPYPTTDPQNDRAPASFPVHRPLRIALIENEGPQEMFRAKLEEKLSRFQHPIGRADNLNTGCLVVQTWRWGSFSFADTDAHKRAAVELDAYAIDLVVGDPLSTLGPAGVGSPEDTRTFVQQLRPLGLGLTRSFLFLHHFRERAERTEDELARVSGAWGGHLDTLITLSSASSDDQARLAWPKLRWAKNRKPAPIILGRLWNTAGFEAIAEEGDATVLEPILYKTFAEMRAAKQGRGALGFATTTDLATAVDRRRRDVTKALEGAPHLFTCLTGEAAKAVGAKRANAKLWGLHEWVVADDEPPDDAQPAPTQTTLPTLSGQAGTSGTSSDAPGPNGHSRALHVPCPPSIEGQGQQAGTETQNPAAAHEPNPVPDDDHEPDLGELLT